MFIRKYTDVFPEYWQCTIIVTIQSLTLMSLYAHFVEWISVLMYLPKQKSG